MRDASSESFPSQSDPVDDPSAAQFRPTGPAIAAGLTLVATPIGNLADMTWRGIAALRAAELVLCEDTRVTARLFAAHNISSKLAPLHDHNEGERVPGLVARLLAGARIALVSDAGTPLISDPGYRLVRAAIEAGVPVQAVPGASAAVVALSVSGLPPHPYLFLGFAPARRAARVAAYQGVRAAERAGLAATLIWYEAPHRLGEALADLASVFGDRPAAVARELTKRFEEVRRDGLVGLAGHYATAEARGEIVILVGPGAVEVAGVGELDAALRGAMAGMSTRDAAAAVAMALGLPRRDVYARALVLARESI